MENVIDKLQKLINHERSARTVGNIAEAEAFAAKIAELLFAHKLTMSEVEMEAEDRDDPVSEEMIEGLRAPWAGVLAVGVSTASFCKALQLRTGYAFIGRPTDRVACIAMFRYLATMGKALSDSELRRYKQTEQYIYESSFRPAIARTWRVSFLRGYAKAIHDRLQSERKALTAQAQSAGSSLIFIGKTEAAISQYLCQKYPHLRAGRSTTSRVHSGAYAAGKAAGSSVSLKSRAALAC